MTFSFAVSPVSRVTTQRTPAGRTSRPSASKRSSVRAATVTAFVPLRLATAIVTASRKRPSISSGRTAAPPPSAAADGPKASRT